MTSKHISHPSSRCLDCLSFGSQHLWSIMLVAVIILPTVMFISIQLPFSMFYNKYHTNPEMLETAKQYNSKRLETASNYFENQSEKDSIQFYDKLNSHSPQLLISIISVGRTGPYSEQMGYLLQTAAVMDKLMKTDKHFPDKMLVICNVNEFPKNNRDADFLERYIPYVQWTGQSSFNRTFPSHRRSRLDGHKTLERKKELEDYVFCLNASLSFHPTYILMVEDDAMAHLNMFEVLKYTLDKQNFHVSNLDDDNAYQTRHDFAFLKLYYPERWQGFAFELHRVVELVSAGAVCGGLFYITLRICLKNQNRYSIHVLYFVSGFVISILTFIMIGRQNLMDLRRGSPQLFKFGPSPRCCTPAMFYNANIVSGLTDFLLYNTSLNKDLGIYEYTETINMPGYLLEPNLFHHLGMFTSLSNKYKPPEEFQFDMG